jgi:predicted CXXCH cytochrome family protein
LLSLNSAQAAGIAGSAHDFSGETWSGGQICVTCHTPHGANTTVADAPLWNHTLTASTFTVYASGTMNATVGAPDGASKLCLSCHDGTVALDSFGGNTSNTGDKLTGSENLGTDLRNDHPISFVYNSALATTDGGLRDPSTADSGLGGTIAAKMLISGKVQCASCHDVHNGAGVGSLLLKSNSGSALCLTCHNK